ncbi:MAG: tRNA (adenosine(37)-N6)-threonylcarbamoyltransferase complex dimerization subunit type 1 TsaB [Mogibacterium sp.]|nr:tRNA (adenosine(37)-N6)-threonylcarbamoyltransferase complex dimerization subunit type 1 TsaB [Mogibacterium sp.]
MMNILALETTGKFGSAAVIRDDGSIFASESSAEMNHLKDIITISEEAIERAGISKKDLTHVASSVGPGSFTGIRIGVTTARTLGQVLGIPCISVSSLRAMAERVLGRAAASDALYVAAIINARRHQTYAGAWQVAQGDNGEYVLEPCMEEKQYMIEDLLADLKQAQDETGGVIFFTGDGIDAYESIITETLAEGTYILAGEDIRYQHAEDVARIALEYAREGRTTGYDEMMPEYMRLSEAEQRLREGTLSDKIRRTVR